MDVDVLSLYDSQERQRLEDEWLELAKSDMRLMAKKNPKLLRELKVALQEVEEEQATELKENADANSQTASESISELKPSDEAES